MAHAAGADASWSRRKIPFELLGAALDDLVETGRLPETGAREPSPSPGPPSTVALSSSSTVPCAAFIPPRPTTRAGTSST
ncbi:hypothetical protein ACFY7H_33810 [Streptomyces sp. NPDC012794]|uniref:hypothetical protein n=1 Tax=Streptomyces sp. NPDC012794 TaxID=3364850 RepID=UPI0036846E51